MEVYNDLKELGISRELVMTVFFDDKIMGDDKPQPFKELFEENTSRRAMTTKNGVVASDGKGNYAIYKDETYMITKSPEVVERLKEDGFQEARMFVLDGDKIQGNKQKAMWERVKESCKNEKLLNFRMQRDYIKAGRADMKVIKSNNPNISPRNLGRRA